MIGKTRARLLAALTEEEARFLIEFEIVLDGLDDRAVSETARRLHLTPQEDTTSGNGSSGRPGRSRPPSAARPARPIGEWWCPRRRPSSR